jgi:hypothetical protein
MGPLAIGILSLTIAGAVASWIVAAIYAVRTIASIDGPDRSHLRWLAIVAWPFAAQRFQGEASANAAVVNKAIVAFIVCVTLAIVTVSLATNFNRITR